MKENVRLFVIGLVMGAAEIIPGVSGGTIAFVTGIYERFVNAIQGFNPLLFRKLKFNGLKKTWQELDVNFLLILFSGMGIAILLFAGFVTYLLEEQAIFIWSFFFGLVVASVWLVIQQISRFGWDIAFSLVLGTAFGMTVATLAPVELEPAPVTLFLGGAIAVCAWILPGLSGSFILLILGLYRHVLEAIRSLDMVVLLTLGAGCVLGIVAFTQLLTRLLRDHHNETFGLLTGFMVGSLVKLWPWQYVSSYHLKSDGSQIALVQDPVSPFVYLDLTGNNPELVVAIFGLILGCIGVVGLNFLAHSDADVSSDKN
ncbi:MAG: DUF368 domain-containing protein [bacterium]